VIRHHASAGLLCAD